MFETQAYLAAVNALIAEHALSLVELVPQNPFAKQLKDGIHRGVLAGTRGTRDSDWWLKQFNHADRLVQLNFVAIGFNELEEAPSLPREYWRAVRNPMVVRGIANKLPKAHRYILRTHGLTVRLRTARLVLTEWGLSETSMSSSPGQEERVSPAASSAKPHMTFMTELPHPEVNVPLDLVKVGNMTFLYYEHPKTIGVVAGMPSMFDYPQCVVVSDESNPLMIVRAETSAHGTMLCVVEPDGRRLNFGHFAVTDKRAFLLKATSIVASQR